MVQITIQRRHLFIFAALVAAVLVVWPSMSNASHTFDDVPEDNIFHADTDWLAANGVTKGCNPSEGNTKFCPESAVTRQQMAAFMKRLATGGSVDAGAVGGVDASAVLARLDALEAENAALQALLAGVTRDGDVLFFEGMNLQVVNGDGSTATKNGLGNLIIGYNVEAGNTRTGSHYLVIGDRHSYTSYGGAVIGAANTASGPYASVSGGAFNTASGPYASVSGGTGNNANGRHASVSGGFYSDANGEHSSITGGTNGIASAASSSIHGGIGNRIYSTSHYGTILGGVDNIIESGNAGVILGRTNNTLTISEDILPW